MTRSVSLGCGMAPTSPLRIRATGGRRRRGRRGRGPARPRCSGRLGGDGPAQPTGGRRGHGAEARQADLAADPAAGLVGQEGVEPLGDRRAGQRDPVDRALDDPLEHFGGQRLGVGVAVDGDLLDVRRSPSSSRSTVRPRSARASRTRRPATRRQRLGQRLGAERLGDEVGPEAVRPAPRPSPGRSPPASATQGAEVAAERRPGGRGRTGRRCPR